MAKFSRDKGARGEREIVKALGPKWERTGYAGTDNPDVSSEWAVISVKNTATPLSLSKVEGLLRELESQKPKLEHFVAVKVNHTWLVIERLEQFRDDRCS